MWSITLKLMKKSGKMLIPAGIAIMIGTAFIAATFLFGNSLNDSITSQITAQYARANYIISQQDDADDSSQSDGGDDDGGMYVTSNQDGADDSSQSEDGDDEGIMRVGDVNLDKIRAVDGVEGADAAVSEQIRVSHGSKHALTYGVNTSSDARLVPVSVQRGSLPGASGEIALPEGIARDLNISLGDRIDVVAQAETTGIPVAAKVVGLTDDPSQAYQSYGGAAILSYDVISALQNVDSYDDVQTGSGVVLLSIDADKSSDAVRRIRAMLPKGYVVGTRQAIGDKQVKEISGSGSSAITIFLMIFGVLAMVVAALVIANTFQVMVAQRRRTLALLRAIGARKGQLYRSVLIEAGILGALSSLLGLLVGIGLMAVMCGTKFIGDGMHVIVTWPVVVVPVVFGVVVTMLASISSARSATSVTPLEALRPFEMQESRTAGRVRGLLGTLVLVGGCALCALSLMRVHALPASGAAESEGDVVIMLVLVGCVFVFLGLVITAVFWLPWFMHGAGTLVSSLGPSAKVAAANIRKNSKRVAATGVALLIGVTLVSTIATGAASVKKTVNDAMDAHYSVDMSVQGSALSPRAAKRLAAVDGVKDTLYAPTAVTDLKGSGSRPYSKVLVVGVPSVQSLSKVLHTDLNGVNLDDGTALVPARTGISGQTAKLSGSGEITQPARGGREAYSHTVRLEQRDYREVSSSYELVVFVAASQFSDTGLKADGHMLLAGLDTGRASMASIFDKVGEIAGEYGGIAVSGPAAERQQWNMMIDSLMAMVVGLLAIAILIALIGVANTLSLSVIERTRESATLRAIGMTRGQLKRSLACESLLISVVAGLVGIAVGTGFGWLGSYEVMSMFGASVTYTFAFDWRFNLVLLLVSIVAALLSSILPARRAVRTAPVEALAEA